MELCWLCFISAWIILVCGTIPFIITKENSYSFSFYPAFVFYSAFIFRPAKSVASLRFWFGTKNRFALHRGFFCLALVESGASAERYRQILWITCPPLFSSLPSADANPRYHNCMTAHTCWYRTPWAPLLPADFAQAESGTPRGFDPAKILSATNPLTPMSAAVVRPPGFLLSAPAGCLVLPVWPGFAN